MKRVQWAIGILGLSVLVSYGCGEDVKPRNGERSEAGEGSTLGGAAQQPDGSAGAGGDVSDDRHLGGAAGQTSACGPYPLSELCDPHPQACPPSPDDLILDLCHIETVTRFDSSCDGVVIRRSDGLTTTTLAFDETGALTGVVVDGDVDETCDDGSSSSTTIYGSSCEPQGIGQDLCAEVGAGGAGGAGGTGG